MASFSLDYFWLWNWIPNFLGEIFLNINIYLKNSDCQVEVFSCWRSRSCWICPHCATSYLVPPQLKATGKGRGLQQWPRGWEYPLLFRGPGWNSQQPHENIITPVPGDPLPSPDFCGHQVHTWYSYTCADKHSHVT